MKKFEKGKQYTERRGDVFTFEGLTDSGKAMFTGYFNNLPYTVICTISAYGEAEIALATRMPGFFNDFEEFNASDVVEETAEDAEEPKKFEVGKEYADHNGRKFTFDGLTVSGLAKFTRKNYSVVCNLFFDGEKEIAVAKSFPGIYHNFEEFHADGKPIL